MPAPPFVRNAPSLGVDAAVKWVRLLNSTSAGEDTIVIDRTPGLLDILPESRLLIDVGDSQHEYKAITPLSVTGSTIVLPSDMDYAHNAGDTIAILAPGEGIPATWLGCGGSAGSDATKNKNILNRFAAHNGLAHLAGGSGILFDGDVVVDDSVFVRGSTCWFRGIGGQVTGGSITEHANMTWPGDLSKSLIAVQDDSGVHPTMLDDTNDGSPFTMAEMSLVGSHDPNSVGIVYSPIGGYVKSIKYRWFEWGWCFGNGKGADLANMQGDFCRNMMVPWNNGWTLKNYNCTQDVFTGITANLRMIGGEGGTLIGGDLEVTQAPGRLIAMEGDATGLYVEGCWPGGIAGGSSGTLIDIDTDSPAYYEFVNLHCNISNDPNYKFLRDVQRNFSIQTTPADIYARKLWARTISDTQTIFTPGSTATSPASSGVPHAAGTLA